MAMALFVAVSWREGPSTWIMTSPDGINWTRRASIVTADWTSVTYGNGLFVAVSWKGTIQQVMTSGNYTEHVGTIIGSNIGIGTATSTRILGIGGEVARNIGMERRTTPDTVGNALTINAGGATVGATNRAGGDLILASGIATGTGASNINFQTATAGGAGPTDNTPATRMTITGAGNIGIGTTAPTRRLAIVDPGVGFDRPALDTLAMFTANVERMRIDSAGNIGIGTISPLARLDVRGTITNIGGFTTSPLTTPAVPTVVPQGTVGTTSYGYRITARSSAGETLPSPEGPTNTGNANLTVTNFNRITWTAVPGAVDYRIYRVFSGGTPSTNGLIGTTTTLTFDDTGLAASGLVPTTDNSGNIGIGTTAPTRRLAIVDPGVGFDRPALNVLAMFTADTERMRIDSAGNIGIGTTAPTRRLAIVDPGVGFDRPILNTLAMFTADTERMRIDSAGNIGIGTTLPNSRLHVAGSFATRVDTITATTTLNETHHIILCDATNEVVTINLPVALDVAGRQYITKKIDASANACIVDPAGSETIDGIATHNLTTQWASRGFVSNGTNWFGISTNPQGSIAQYSNDNQSILSNLTDSVKSVLQGLGLVIENGIARIRELSADRIITKEIQMIDRATGCTYYIWIEGGEWKKEIGECGAVPENTPSEPEPEPAPEFISSIPDPIVNPDTNPSNLGTNDDSGEEGEEGYPLAE